MDEDCEITNARAWRDDIPDGPSRTDDESLPSKWQIVGRGKRQQHPTRDKYRPPMNENDYRRPRQSTSSFLHDKQLLGRQLWSPYRPLPGASQQTSKPQRPGRPPQLPPVHLRRAPKLIYDDDNDGQVLWRAHRQPAVTVSIPRELVMMDHEPDGCAVYEGLARDHGTYIHHNHSTDGKSGLSFGIWGDAVQIAATRRAILSWIRRELPLRREAATSSFMKVSSQTDEQRRRSENKWLKDVKKQRFRQNPPSNLPFGAIGSFHWPHKEWRPEEVFGKSYEAFDPIRMDFSVYLLYNRERSLFQVLGNIQDVQNALIRIRKACFQVTSRSLNPIRVNLLRWPDPSDVSTLIRLNSYYDPIELGQEVDMAEPSWSPRGDGLLDDEKELERAQTTSMLSTERVRVTLADVLRKIHYYTGQIVLRVRLGTFILMQYQKPEHGMYYELKKYEEMINQSQCIGRVTEELGDIELESKVFAKVLGADKMLCPQEAMARNLSDVRPTYTAVFVFEEELGDVRLSVSWQEITDFENGTQFTDPKVEWTRLDRDTGKPNRLVDMSMTDLRTGSAWQFDMVTYRRLEKAKIPYQLSQFASQVKIIPDVALNRTPNRLFVSFNPFVKLKSLRQNINYHYGIRHTDYTLELTQFQDRVYEPGQTPTDPVKPKVTEIRWGLSVFRFEWDTMLGRNEHLPIGESADWDDAIETWFPQEWGLDSEDDKNGFQQLMMKLESIENLVRSEMVEEDLLG